MAHDTEKGEQLELLQSLEKIVETVWVAFAKGYAALGEILAKKLYRAAGYKTEDEYLEKRWGELSRSQLFHKKRMASVAAAIGSENLPEGVRESHLAALAAFNDEPEFQRQILKEAQKAAPNGKPTADDIEKTAHRLMDERKAAIKAQKEAEMSRPAIAGTVGPVDDGDDEDDEEDDAEPTPAPKPQATKPSSTVGRASSHPIADEGRQRKKIGQAIRTIRKLDRIALELDCTREDLLERFDSGDLEDALKQRAG